MAVLTNDELTPPTTTLDAVNCPNTPIELLIDELNATSLFENDAEFITSEPDTAINEDDRANKDELLMIIELVNVTMVVVTDELLFVIAVEIDEDRGAIEALND
jgi:hypothetical protein